MPIGMPMSSARATATSISAIVTIVSSQKPSTPQAAIASTPTIAALAPPVRQPMSPVRASTPGQRSARSTHSTASLAAERTSEIGSKIRVNSQWVSLLRTVHW
jgi:hypothetical protein